MRRIDLIVQKKADPPSRLEIERIGYVFCPEHAAALPARIESLGGCDLWLFGPGTLPPQGDAAENDASSPVPALVSADIETDHPSETEAAAPDSQDDQPSDQRSQRITECRPVDREASQAPTKSVVETSESFGIPVTAAVCSGSDAPEPGDGRILLGYRDPGETPLYWHTVIQANPHLMILGLPGMGKTTCLINICVQLARQGITPIVFSYHQDIDEKLSHQLESPPLAVKKECRKDGLAFVVASQEAKDFDSSLFTAIANYLALRLSEADAKLMAKSFAASDHVKLVADRIKQMPKYSAMYYAEGMPAPTRTRLLEQPPD
ncbi:hypothetical protein CKO25_17360 [Thiocapsa imhoffii]|uniref:ATP-binding protein n=2 Tax=Thiocapsa imhoffii TaxID=382777 RepID=A0A9X0WL43_9GAMM|nr:hypothetical protein [Thiocapsa imhoffii]